MPQDYFSLVTNQGLIKEAASNEPGGTAINLTEMAVGDSNGTYYDPDGSETALANEVHRVTLTHVVVDENNTNQLIVEAVLDETIGPFYIREVGIFDSNGDLFAIGKYPETFKPNLPAGSGKRLYIRMILGFANSPNVNLVINNDIALDPNFGTDINNALAERLIKTNNLSDLDDVATARSNLGLGSASLAGNATESEKGISQIATQIITNGNSNDTDFVTAKKLDGRRSSESLAGIASIATQIEVDAGIDNTKIITPNKLAGIFNNSSLSGNGYIRIPVKIAGAMSEFIFQWGYESGNGNRTVNFPIAFPNSILGAQVTAASLQTGSSNIYQPRLRTFSTSQLSYNVDVAVSDHSRWLVYGY